MTNAPESSVVAAGAPEDGGCEAGACVAGACEAGSEAGDDVSSVVLLQASRVNANSSANTIARNFFILFLLSFFIRPRKSGAVSFYYIRVFFYCFILSLLI
jgi:hypothetical protein